MRDNQKLDDNEEILYTIIFNPLETTELCVVVAKIQGHFRYLYDLNERKKDIPLLDY